MIGRARLNMDEVDKTQEEKKPAKISRKLILGYSLETWLIVGGVVLAIPLVNMVALPIILFLFAIGLLLYFWRLRKSY